MLERDYSEKRDFIRMRIDTPAQVHIEQEGVITEGICNDLSGSGMLLTVAQELPIDSELVITLTPNENKGPSLQARCRIARAQKAGQGEHLLGLEILEIVAEKDAQVA